ncbi:MAG: hypothetical protein GXY01_10190 [Clostridiales bacterium]|nr:hypothetical protein [Clostridiales bacterium]
MDDRQFQKLIEEVGELTPAQFKKLVQAYANSGGLDAGRVWDGAVYSVSEQKLTGVIQTGIVSSK